MRLLVAALLFATGCGGCGSNPGTTDSGDDVDGAVDADIDADPNVRGTVTVHVVDKLGLPLTGFHAIFIDTDQTVTDVLTDAAGTASASVYPNASVTVERVHASAMAFTLTTVLALVPGDEITLISVVPGASMAEDPFSIRTVPLATADLATATKSGSTATFTTLEPHGLAVTDNVIISGADASSYNGVWQVASVPSTTTFTANLGSGNFGSATTGLASKVYLVDLTFTSYAGATSYTVFTPCGPVDVGTNLTPQLRLRAGCAGTSMSLTVVARGSGNPVLAYATQTAVAPTAGSVTVTDTWHTAAAFGATFTNPTSRVTQIEMERFVPYARGNAVSTGSTNVSGAMGTIDVMSSQAPAAVIRTSLRCPQGTSPDCLSSSTVVAQQYVTEAIDGSAASYALDVDTSLLPWMTITYDMPNTTIKAAPLTTGAIDLFQAEIHYSGATSSGARSQQLYDWRVFGPTIGDVKFPTLPSTLPGDPTVRPTDLRQYARVYACETTGVNGYRAAIKNPYETLGACEVSASPATRPFSVMKSRLSQVDF